MADIHIQREHGLGLAEARKIAFKWAEQVEEKFDMECTYEEGKTEDLVSFTRSGVSGTLVVTKDSFDLNAKLGFLLGAFKDKIEGEIVKNLDTLIAKKPAAKKAAAKKKVA
ncbi:polyhydroxyalkanoic acid system family protein [Polaromonas sp. JS666]|jgi:putative polyhydroxyalkanoate system protein|uniref:polyhydroxyalkanoic acid system family protein n=1 Tax=Polaromonas sp. (strain JS666 / ATCC BAA-500) TaxID=296591 RepID=UPI000889A6AB|nr:polyhydroxyalkanoic acid system family protein [Polaromonas sp. JS666]SDN00989.1 putative polyhydroxyalkanoic acid system protein [Polaromonas sp. JS666]